MTNIKLTQRDYEVLQFIKEYKVADINTIQALFFPSIPTAEKRMKKLCEARKLNRSREDILHPYVYYKNSKPSNLKHSLALSQIYSILQSEYEVVKERREYQFKYYNKILQPDLLVVIRRYGKLIPLLIEVDLSKAYKNKYDSFINNKVYQNFFPIEPIVLVISNYTPKSNTNIVWIRLEELNNIKNLL